MLHQEKALVTRLLSSADLNTDLVKWRGMAVFMLFNSSIPHSSSNSKALGTWQLTMVQQRIERDLPSTPHPLR